MLCESHLFGIDAAGLTVASAFRLRSFSEEKKSPPDFSPPGFQADEVSNQNCERLYLYVVPLLLLLFL
jgi:hypothetical protein